MLHFYITSSRETPHVHSNPSQRRWFNRHGHPPKRILEITHLQSGSQVEIDVQDGKIVIAPKKPHYTLAEIMAQCDLSQPMSEEERDWLEAPSFGEEL